MVFVVFIGDKRIDLLKREDVYDVFSFLGYWCYILVQILGWCFDIFLGYVDYFDDC